MLRYILRRLIIIPFALAAVNFLGFAYAHLALRFHEIQNPFGAADPGLPPIGTLYRTYIEGVMHFDFGVLPVAGNP
jgi:hypothetical protein